MRNVNKDIPVASAEWCTQPREWDSVASLQSKALADTNDAIPKFLYREKKCKLM